MDILMLGHSLIEFFDWRERFPAHNVINLGLSGETVEGLLDRIDSIAGIYQRADMIFVMTGANNVIMGDFDFTGTYERIIIKLKRSYPDAKIYVNSVLPVLFPWVNNASIVDVNRSLREISKKLGVEYLDVYSAFVQDDMPAKEYVLDDGVHLSDEGYAVWADIIERALDEE